MFIYENSTTGVKNFNISSFLNSEFIAVDDTSSITENFNRLYSDLTKTMFSHGVQKKILVENYNTLLSRLIIGQNKENIGDSINEIHRKHTRRSNY
jgi:type I restriction enzyme S subunit